MPESVGSRWPVLGRHDRALEWLRIWIDLGRAPRTIDAYARGLAEYLQVCEREGIDPLTATRAHVAVFVRELTSRPSRRGPNVVALDSGAGLANATLQQRLVPVRLFYDFLVEEGVRESNPVGRGRYTPGRSGGRASALVPRMVKLPWIPSEAEWLRLLGVVADEPIRNRAMLALAYDGRSAGRSCARCAATILTRLTAPCGCVRRRPRPATSGWCRIRRPPACCCRNTCSTGPR